jgi:hypothetical protein
LLYFVSRSGEDGDLERGTKGLLKGRLIRDLAYTSWSFGMMARGRGLGCSTHLQGYVTHLLLSEPTLTLGPGLGRLINGTYDVAQAIILPMELMLRWH